MEFVRQHPELWGLIEVVKLIKMVKLGHLRQGTLPNSITTINNLKELFALVKELYLDVIITLILTNYVKYSINLHNNS